MNTAKKITSTDLLTSITSRINWRETYNDGRLTYREKSGWLSTKQIGFLLDLMQREGILPPYSVANSDFFHCGTGVHIKRPMPNGARSWSLTETIPPMTFSDLFMETAKGKKSVKLKMDLITKGKVSPEKVDLILKCSSVQLYTAAESFREDIRNKTTRSMNDWFAGMVDAIEQIIEIRKADPDWIEPEEKEVHFV